MHYTCDYTENTTAMDRLKSQAWFKGRKGKSLFDFSWCRRELQLKIQAFLGDTPCRWPRRYRRFEISKVLNFQCVTSQKTRIFSKAAVRTSKFSWLTSLTLHLFYGTGTIDTNMASIVDCITISDLWIELAMDEEETQKNGLVLIIDLGGFPARLFKFLTPKATIISALKEEVTLDCKLPNCDCISYTLATYRSLNYSRTHSQSLWLTFTLSLINSLIVQFVL